MKTIHLLAVLCALFISVNIGLTTTVLAAETTPQAAETVAAKINLNTADAASLVNLPGVGEKTAAAIIEYRQANGAFKSVDELAQVKGIGEKKLAKLKPYLQAL